jgi:hypothetical protein
MKTTTSSEENVQIINLWADGKLWTTIKVPKGWAEHLVNCAKRAGITLDEAFERAIRKHIKEAA